MITHDRHMLDRVCTDLVGLHGDGRWGNYGSVAQWQLVDQERRTEASTVTKEPPKRDPAARPRKSGLTFLEKKEWDEMEVKILAAEDEVACLQAELDDPIVATDHEKLHAAFEAHRAAQAMSSALYARWEELEQKRLAE